MCETGLQRLQKAIVFKFDFSLSTDTDYLG